MDHTQEIHKLAHIYHKFQSYIMHAQARMRVYACFSLDSPRSLQVLCITEQEGRQVVAGTMPERTVRDNGCKPTVLSEVREEFNRH
jgi:hypothetical protein